MNTTHRGVLQQNEVQIYLQPLAEQYKGQQRAQSTEHVMNQSKIQHISMHQYPIHSTAQVSEQPVVQSVMQHPNSVQFSMQLLRAQNIEQQLGIVQLSMHQARVQQGFILPVEQNIQSSRFQNIQPRVQAKV